MLARGQYYSRQDISRALGGNQEFFLPHVNGRVVVSNKHIFVNQDVADYRAAYEFVRVDTGSRGAPGLVVVLNLIVPDERLSAVIGQADAHDIILDDVVNNVRAADARVQPDAITCEGRGRAVLDAALRARGSTWRSASPTDRAAWHGRSEGATTHLTKCFGGFSPRTRGSACG